MGLPLAREAPDEETLAEEAYCAGLLAGLRPPHRMSKGSDVKSTRSCLGLAHSDLGLAGFDQVRVRTCFGVVGPA